MRRIVLWLASTVTVVVLMFGYHTSTNSAATPATPTAVSSPSATTGPSSAATPSAEPSTASSSPTASSPTASGSASPSTASGTTAYTGAVAQTRWGPVEVQLTVSRGKITTVDVVEYPQGNPRDAEINARALPTLVGSTLTAQSAQIDMVSGATVTSVGYVQSVQSALDEAGL